MLKFALRVLWKNRLFSFLNIVGLTFGLSASIWLLLFLSHELTYDQHFTHHQRVYRVSHVLSAPGVEFNTAFSAPELPEKMMEELPGIENFSRFPGADAWMQPVVCFSGSTCYIRTKPLAMERHRFSFQRWVDEV